MLPTRDTARRNLPAIGAGIRCIIMFVVVLSLPLAAAEELGLNPTQSANWVFALYGLPGAIALVLAVYYRQPLLMTGNLFVIIFIVSLGGEIGYAELVGAGVVAGAGMVAISLLGLTERLAAWIPSSIVMGLLAGAVLPFVADAFTQLGAEPMLVGSTFAAYLLSSRLLGDRVPPILPAIIVGLAAAAVGGDLGALPDEIALPPLAFTRPVFRLEAILTAAPVLLVLMTLQANVPAIVFLRAQSYQPPERALNVTTGIGSIIGSLLGPTAVSVPLALTPLVAGPEAGEHHLRHRAVYIAGAGSLGIGLLCAVAADLPALIPLPLLLALAGLALINVLANALKQITRGPLLLGPVFAFAVALSDLSLLGFGRFFWSLVIGMAISLLLEQDALRAWRAEATGAGT